MLSGVLQMRKMPSSGAECEILSNDGEPVLGAQPKWSSDESLVYFRRSTADVDRKEVWVVNRDGSNARKLVEYGPLQTLDPAFVLLPDGNVLWKKYERGDDEIWMAEIDW